MQKPRVIAIVGPTASGKSALGNYLAQKFNGEIVSADSRQVYKGMEIISRSERGHMVGIKNPRQAYSTGEYIKDAQKIISKILKRGRLPVVVGGAGFYADPLLRGWTLPQVEPNKKLRATLEKKPVSRLFARLQRIDPVSAKRVDPYNKVRLVRAIEIAEALGSVPALAYEPPYETLWLGLKPDEKKYKKLIEKGVHERLKKGMIKEAKKLRASLPQKRFLELGFEFALLAGYLDKIGPRPTRLGREISEKVLVEKIVQGELRYATRQMRWFKRNADIHWIKNKTEAVKLARAFYGPSRVRTF